MTTLVSVSSLGNTQLLAAYNELAAVPVKRFADHQSAVKRTELLLGQKSMVLTVTPTADPNDCVRLSVQERGKPVVYLCPRVVAEVVPPAKARRGRVGAFSESAWIIVLAKTNPKRPGSAAHRHFALYQSRMTVGAYMSACLASDQAAGDRVAKTRDWYRQNVRWDLAHGHISVTEA